MLVPVAAGLDRRGMASLSAGHLATDMAQGTVPAILVFLVPKLGLSNTLAGAVVLVSAFASSLVQPLFGLWSDRRGAMWLLPGGVALVPLSEPARQRKIRTLNGGAFGRERRQRARPLGGGRRFL